MRALTGTGRIAAYVVAAAVAVLLLATISERRLASYASLPAVALLAIVAGGITAAIPVLLRRLPVAPGCAPFAAAVVLVNAVLFLLVTSVAPEVRFTPLGAALGAVFVAVAGGIVFTLWDEPMG